MDIKKVLLDSIDLEKLVAGLLVEGLEPALKKVVEDSSNPVDDAIFAMVYPPLKNEIQRLVAAEVAKLKA
jgi:hypothetical protein